MNRLIINPLTRQAIVVNSFCPTGEGGGIDPTCSSGGDKVSGGVTSTPAFKKWFSGSKVVDASGNPLVVYHGTTEEFDNFSDSHKDSINKKRGVNTEKGFFFAPDPEVASRYTGWDENFPSEKIGQVLPVYLSIKNPLTVDFKGGKYGRREAIDKAIAEGHDGVRFLNHYDAGGVQEQWIAFKPNQIKSATANKGTFNPNSPIITNLA